MKTTKYPVKARSSNVVVVAARWAGGGAASNMTKVEGRGISSVDYNSATGGYLVTFEDLFGQLLAFTATCANARTAAAQNVVSYQIADYSSTAGTMPIWITAVATPTGADLATTEEISIIAVFADTGLDQ